MKIDWLELFVKCFITVVFVLVVGWFISLGYLAFTASHAIEKDGVKGVVTRLWCGDHDPNCSLPSAKRSK